jgi:Uma2 family endonuclease
MNDPHAQAIQLTLYALLPHYAPSVATIRIQLPMRLGETSRPEPDVSVVPGTPRQNAQHPGKALLVIEVSDTTLDFDRKEKAGIYVRNGIPEYWIINLSGRCVEVHRNPIVNETDARYGEVRVVGLTESLSPLSAPNAKLTVADLLP